MLDLLLPLLAVILCHIYSRSIPQKFWFILTFLEPHLVAADLSRFALWHGVLSTVVIRGGHSQQQYSGRLCHLNNARLFLRGPKWAKKIFSLPLHYHNQFKPLLHDLLFFADRTGAGVVFCWCNSSASRFNVILPSYLANHPTSCFCACAVYAHNRWQTILSLWIWAPSVLWWVKLSGKPSCLQ